MKSIFIGLFVVIVAFLGVMYIVDTDSSDLPENSTPTSTPPNQEYPNENDDNKGVTAPTGFREYVEPEHLYRIATPYNVDVSNPQENITRYRYVGSDNEPNSEITDGYTITVEAQSVNETSLENLVDQIIESENEVTEEPQPISVAEYEGFRYVTESALGNKSIPHFVLLPGNGYGYNISVNISPLDNASYKATTEEILNTLQFLDDATAQSMQARIVPIAMLDYDGVGRESSGKERGCDKVVLIEHVLSQSTTMPLNASLRQLFAYEEDVVGGWHNFVANQNKTLSFNRAEIVGTTAKIYLTGELGPLGGVCDNPRTAIQIEETALAYDSVDSVELYLNNEPTTLIPSGRGE